MNVEPGEIDIDDLRADVERLEAEFSQASRTVEQARDALEVLPKWNGAFPVPPDLANAYRNEHVAALAWGAVAKRLRGARRRLTQAEGQNKPGGRARRPSPLILADHEAVKDLDTHPKE